MKKATKALQKKKGREPLPTFYFSMNTHECLTRDKDTKLVPINK